MYGTIFNLKVKPGHEAALIKVFNEEQGNPAGAVALFVMQPDANGPWIGVAVFESSPLSSASQFRYLTQLQRLH